MPDNIFWALWLVAVIVGSAGCGFAITALIRWCDTPANRYVDRVDVKRCERAGSQGEIERRIRTAVGR